MTLASSSFMSDLTRYFPFRCVLASFQDRIAVLDACQFKQMFCIMSKCTSKN